MSPYKALYIERWALRMGRHNQCDSAFNPVYFTIGWHPLKADISSGLLHVTGFIVDF